MARLRYNGLTATLDATGLTAAATSIGFTAALTGMSGAVPTITGSDYIPLIIDNEIVYLTAYTTGALSGTITRAQESTTAATHAAGATVENGPTVADFASGISADYISFTPNLTAATTNPTLGTGAVKEGRYVQIGKHVEVDGYIQFGTSGTNAGSGEYRVDLPVAAAVGVSYGAIGYAWTYSAAGGAGISTWVALRVSSTQVKFFRSTGASNFAMNNGVPAAWGAGDQFAFHFAYEAA